jgi:hypothetical protein
VNRVQLRYSFCKVVGVWVVVVGLTQTKNQEGYTTADSATQKSSTRVIFPAGGAIFILEIQKLLLYICCLKIAYSCCVSG